MFTYCKLPVTLSKDLHPFLFRNFFCFEVFISTEYAASFHSVADVHPRYFSNIIEVHLTFYRRLVVVFSALKLSTHLVRVIILIMTSLS